MKFLILFLSFLFSFSVFSSPFFTHQSSSQLEKLNYSVNYTVYSVLKEEEIKGEIIQPARPSSKEIVNIPKKPAEKSRFLKREEKEQAKKETEFKKPSPLPNNSNHLKNNAPLFEAAETGKEKPAEKEPKPEKKSEIIFSEEIDDELKIQPLERSKEKAYILPENSLILEEQFHLDRPTGNSGEDSNDKNFFESSSELHPPTESAKKFEKNYFISASFQNGLKYDFINEPLQKEEAKNADTNLNTGVSLLNETEYEDNKGVYLNPDYIENKIIYPESARRMRMEGSVILQGVITEEGVVKDLKIISSSGYKILDNSALAQVKTWKFIPARSPQGENISTAVKIPVKFEINK